MAYGKMADTWNYRELWAKKDDRVEDYFVGKWGPQFEEIRSLCRDIKTRGEKLEDDEGNWYWCAFFGSIFTQTPSGKYYVPFASSNVSVKGAAIDEIWHEVFQDILNEEGCWDQSGEGDPCDIFICKAC